MNLFNSMMYACENVMKAYIMHFFSDYCSIWFACICVASTFVFQLLDFVRFCESFFFLQKTSCNMFIS